MKHLYEVILHDLAKELPAQSSILPKDGVLAVAAAAILAIQTLFRSSPTGDLAKPITNHHQYATAPQP